jgi:transcriptional regulator with XRE-family HTH domain
MDNGNEIRDFLVSRRARITPEQAGLPAYGGNRRVAGLRREEVALLAGVSIDYYNRLERGRAAGASDALLEGVARALHLDEAERAHLFDLARAAAPAPPRAPRRPGPPPSTRRPRKAAEPLKAAYGFTLTRRRLSQRHGRVNHHFAAVPLTISR